MKLCEWNDDCICMICTYNEKECGCIECLREKTPFFSGDCPAFYERSGADGKTEKVIEED